jgi:cytochrome P450
MPTTAPRAACPMPPAPPPPASPAATPLRPLAPAERLAQARAAWHETGLYLASHPGAFALARISRRLRPVQTLPVAGTVVNDLRVAREILSRDDVFLKSGRRSMGDLITQVMGPYALLNMDGPAHRDLRSRLQDLFTPAYVDTLAGAVLAPLLRALRASLLAGEAVDLVRFTRLLTGKMTCHMLGVAVADAEDVGDPGAAERAYLQMVDLGEAITAHVRFSMKPLPPAQLARVQAPYERLVAYARESYAREDGDPQAIIRRLRRLGLSFEEARSVIAVFFLVGTQTTAVAIPRIVGLLVDTGQQTLLRARPGLLAGAVDEGLRVTTPSPATLRVAARDTDVQGHRFRAGQRALILTYNLARDPHLFPQPDRFEITRAHDPLGRHLWFGHGPHFCLGFALARREMRDLLGALVALPAPLRIVHRRAARNVFLPQYRRFVVRLERPARGQGAAA